MIQAYDLLSAVDKKVKPIGKNLILADAVFREDVCFEHAILLVFYTVCKSAHNTLTLFFDELVFAGHKFQISLLICCE